MDLGALANILCHLQQFKALFEDHGIETIVAPDGERINLFDIMDIYSRRYMLPVEDAILIEVSLYHSANGHGPDDPRIIAVLRQLCIITGTEYREPALQLLGSRNFLRGPT